VSRPIKIPPVLCCIGRVGEVGTQDSVYKFMVQDLVCLYSPPSGKQLYCLKTDREKKSSPADFKRAVETHRDQVSKAMKLYKRWHDFDPVSGSLAKSPRGFLYQAGRAAYIIYNSDKWTGRSTNYIHDFVTPPILWVNKKTKPTLLILTGGQIAVKKEGITG